MAKVAPAIALHLCRCSCSTPPARALARWGGFLNSSRVGATLGPRPSEHLTDAVVGRMASVADPNEDLATLDAALAYVSELMPDAVATDEGRASVKLLIALAYLDQNIDLSELVLSDVSTPNEEQ